MEENYVIELQEKRKRPALRLKRDAPGKPCPRCGEKMEEDAVVCLRCGWNIQTGRKMRGAEAAMRRKRAFGMAAKLVGTAVVAGVLAVAIHWAMGHRDKVQGWIDEGMEEAKVFGIGDDGEKTEDSVEKDDARSRLDKDLPMWQIGDKVVLEKTNGSVLEGVLTKTGNGLVTVETADGLRTTGMSNLSGRSRARVDEAYREEVLRMKRGGK